MDERQAEETHTAQVTGEIEGPDTWNDEDEGNQELTEKEIQAEHFVDQVLADVLPKIKDEYRAKVERIGYSLPLTLSNIEVPDDELDTENHLAVEKFLLLTYLHSQLDVVREGTGMIGYDTIMTHKRLLYPRSQYAKEERIDGPSVFPDGFNRALIRRVWQDEIPPEADHIEWVRENKAVQEGEVRQ